MAGSGHIAGVVNPPDKVKYQYWTSKKHKFETLEDWHAQATEHPGSWWPYWVEWLTKYSGDWTIPRDPGDTLGVIEDAPGRYARTKS